MGYAPIVLQISSTVIIVCGVTLNDRVYVKNSYSLQELTENIHRWLVNMSVALLCEYKRFQKLLIWCRRRTLELQGSCVKQLNCRKSTDSNFLMNAGFLCHSATATMLREGHDKISSMCYMKH